MYCFDKSRRLLKKSDYDFVFDQAKKLVSTEFIFLYRDNTLGHARLGLAISKKKMSKAHDRNRAKRLLRESFRVRCLPSVDIVVLARTNFSKVQNAVINQNLSHTWDKLCGK